MNVGHMLIFGDNFGHKTLINAAGHAMCSKTSESIGIVLSQPTTSVADAQEHALNVLFLHAKISVLLQIIGKSPCLQSYSRLSVVSRPSIETHVRSSPLSLPEFQLLKVHLMVCVSTRDLFNMFGSHTGTDLYCNLSSGMLCPF